MVKYVSMEIVIFKTSKERFATFTEEKGVKEIRGLIFYLWLLQNQEDNTARLIPQHIEYNFLKEDRKNSFHKKQ